jgi:hypothetical protein
MLLAEELNARQLFKKAVHERALAVLSQMTSDSQQMGAESAATSNGADRAAGVQQRWDAK